MLCLSLKVGEWVDVGGAKIQFVLKVRSGGSSATEIKVRVDAPKEIKVRRLGHLSNVPGKSYNPDHVSTGTARAESDDHSRDDL